MGCGQGLALGLSPGLDVVAACHMQHTNAKVSNYGNKLITHTAATTETGAAAGAGAGAVADGQAPHVPQGIDCSCSANFRLNLMYADAQTNK